MQFKQAIAARRGAHMYVWKHAIEAKERMSIFFCMPYGLSKQYVGNQLSCESVFGEIHLSGSSPSGQNYITKDTKRLSENELV